VRQTATRAPLGQAVGVSFLPTLAVATACRICSSVESIVIGFTAAAVCWGDDGADWARGELQPGSNPMRTSGTTHVCRLREQSMMASVSEAVYTIDPAGGPVLEIQFSSERTWTHIDTYVVVPASFSSELPVWLQMVLSWSQTGTWISR